ncbi:MAG: hypothetical protein Q9219_005079 [cf. Caloplaca sp. 3 TL-2023]
MVLPPLDKDLEAYFKTDFHSRFEEDRHRTLAAHGKHFEFPPVVFVHESDIVNQFALSGGNLNYEDNSIRSCLIRRPLTNATSGGSRLRSATDTSTEPGRSDPSTSSITQQPPRQSTNSLGSSQESEHVGDKSKSTSGDQDPPIIQDTAKPTSEGSWRSTKCWHLVTLMAFVLIMGAVVLGNWPGKASSKSVPAVSTPLQENLFKPLSRGLYLIPDGSTNALESGFDSLEKIRAALVKSSSAETMALVNTTKAAIEHYQQVVACEDRLRSTLVDYNVAWSKAMGILHDDITSERIRQDEASGYHRVVAQRVLVTAQNLLNSTQHVVARGQDYCKATSLWDRRFEDLAVGLLTVHSEITRNHMENYQRKRFFWSSDSNSIDQEIDKLSPLHQLNKNVLRHADKVKKETADVAENLQHLIDYLTYCLDLYQGPSDQEGLENALMPIVEKVQDIHKQQMDSAAHPS